MLRCNSSQALVHTREEMGQGRAEMIARVIRDGPDLGPVLSDIDFLEKVVQSRKTIATVAKCAHAVLIFFMLFRFIVVSRGYC